MGYRALNQPVVHGKKQRCDTPPPAFLQELIAWGRTAPAEIFESRSHENVYTVVAPLLGPCQDNDTRRAVMLEVMRVLAGHESSWNWREGVDAHKQREVKTTTTTETGAWQVSANSMHLAKELKNLVISRIGSDDGLKFQEAMKTDHRLAMEYVARLLRNNIKWNGPIIHHNINRNLSRAAVSEFLSILFPRGSDMVFRKGRFTVPFR